MNLKLFLISFLLGLLPVILPAQYHPADDLGDLFVDVQMHQVFEDSKTFPDCVPKSPPEEILKAYHQQKDKAGFKLEQFVLVHFELPHNPDSYDVKTKKPIKEHITKLWNYLKRKPRPDDESGSLIILPNPYIVPGGRFREVYYWDSYFTMLGLAVDGHVNIIRNMVDNFAWLIDEYGFIPNGNRTYYLSRSQPPFFAFMVELLARIEGEDVLVDYLPQMKKEYAFWMNGSDKLTPDKPACQHVALVSDTLILNRYWDGKANPRPEAYREDVMVARNSGRENTQVYRNIRSACESGWDFSSRWLADDKNLTTIETTKILPVDLNSLMYHLERILAKASRLAEETKQAAHYEAQAGHRKNAINRIFWDEKTGFYQDVYWENLRYTGDLSLAGTYPYFVGIAPKNYSEDMATHLQNHFLKPGGMVTTLITAGEQWDYPNAWAPLQWISVAGLKKYGHPELANKAGHRWTTLNEGVYERTGRLMEKYNVVDTTLKAGGGEYSTQDGFGWTNGVYLKMKKN